MTYFCFIESSILSVPHMEALDSDNLTDAKAEAEQLLYQHASGYAAHIFEGDAQRATIRKDGPGRGSSADQPSAQ